MVQVKNVDVGKGVTWIGDGFRIFLKSPGMWIVLGIVMFIIYLVLAIIPFIGGLVASLISPIFAGGMLHAAREADAGRPVEFGHLFRGFQQKGALNGLLALGGVVVAGAILTMIVISVFLGGSFMADMATGGSPDAMPHMFLGVGGLIGALVALAIQIVVIAAVVYAIPLVMFNGTPVGDALSASLRACVTNFLPLLIFSAVYLVLAIVAALPFGLGMLILLPASFGMLYASYRDSFAT